MCNSCWIEYGSPSVDTPAVREAAKAIADVYEFHPTGGNLHIVLDDWNVGDGNLDFCCGAIEENTAGGSVEQLVAEGRCLRMMRELNEDERLSALALQDELWK